MAGVSYFKVFASQFSKLIINKYGLTLAFFLLYWFFFDSSGIFEAISLKNRHKEILVTQAYYTEKTKKVEEEYNNLFSNEDALERFAREEHLMKKEGEDLFIIVEE